MASTQKQMKIKALKAIEMQYDFINLLISCGDAENAPQYYNGQVEQLRGMRDLFDVIFGDAPYTYVATLSMLDKLQS